MLTETTPAQAQTKQMKNKNGFSELIVIVLVIVVVLAIAGIFAFLSFQNNNGDTSEITNQQAIEMAAEPISESNELDDIQAELDATVVGSADEDVDAMNEEASPL